MHLLHCVSADWHHAISDECLCRLPDKQSLFSIADAVSFADVLMTVYLISAGSMLVSSMMLPTPWDSTTSLLSLPPRTTIRISL